MSCLATVPFRLRLSAMCSVSGRRRRLFESVFDDFSIQRPAADFQDGRRLLLVPVDALEDAREDSTGVSAACRNSMSCGRMTRPGDDSAARETVLSSSRMFPGQ